MTKHVKPFIDYPEAANDTRKINGCFYLASWYIAGVSIAVTIGGLVYIGLKLFGVIP